MGYSRDGSPHHMAAEAEDRRACSSRGGVGVSAPKMRRLIERDDVAGHWDADGGWPEAGSRAAIHGRPESRTTRR